MSFNKNILLPVFTDIFCRRPLDAQTSGGSPVDVPAGDHTNFSVIGKYLEGNIILRPDNNRVSFQDIQQGGQFENTTVNSVINATPGSTLDGINITGFTFGQDNNETAKFYLPGSVNIKDVEPRITDFTASMVSATNPEIFEFNVIATENIVSFILTADNQNKTSNYKQFIYGFKNFGTQNVTVQGVTADGVYSNKVTKAVTVLTRPYISYFDLQANYSKYGYGQYFSEFQYSGPGWTTSLLTGKTIPYWVLYPSTYNDGRAMPIYSIAKWINNTGGLNLQINRVDFSYRWNTQGGVYSSGFYLHQDNLTTEEVELSPSYWNLGAANLHLFLTPYNTANTKGITAEILLVIYPPDPPGAYFTSNPNSPLNNPVGLPSTSLNWYGPGLDTSLIWQGTPGLIPNEVISGNYLQSALITPDAWVSGYSLNY